MSLHCIKCEIAHTRKQIVNGIGKVNAPIMFICDYPKYMDNKTGVPLLNTTSGRIFEKILNKIGINNYYLTYVVKCYGGNRIPTQIEIKNCLPHLVQEISTVKPIIIVLLGGLAIRTYWGNPVTKVADNINKIKVNNNRLIISTYHPAHAISPGNNTELLQFVNDLIKVKTLLNLWKKRYPTSMI